MGNIEPAISIIVPMYKTEKYVARCLKSLVNQTFQNIEIICIVAPAEDNSLEICKQFAKKDARIRVITQSPQGLSAARNEGLKYARGTYIQFCDSDDYCALSMCEKLYRMAVDSEADIVVSGIQRINKNAFPVYGGPYFKVPFAGKCSITHEIFKQTNVFAWNKLFKYSIIQQYNIEFPHGLYCEDASFLFKYLMVSKTIYYIDAPLYFYFIDRPGSLITASSVANAPRAMDHLYVLKDIFAFMNVWGLKNTQGIIFSWIVLTYMSLAYRYGTKDMNSEIFNIGSSLINGIEYNQNENEVCSSIIETIKLQALRQNNRDLYFWLEKQTQSSQLSQLKGKLFTFVLKSCFFFPWYIYKTYCMIHDKPFPRWRPDLFLKTYLFFPYYVLKMYLTLVLRTEQCS